MDDLVTSIKKSELVKMIKDTNYKGKVAYKLRSLTSPTNKTVYQLTLMQMRSIVLYNMLQKKNSALTDTETK